MENRTKMWNFVTPHDDKICHFPALLRALIVNALIVNVLNINAFIVNALSITTFLTNARSAVGLPIERSFGPAPTPGHATPHRPTGVIGTWAMSLHFWNDWPVLATLAACCAASGPHPAPPHPRAWLVGGWVDGGRGCPCKHVACEPERVVGMLPLYIVVGGA